jgi:hypothetical protein
VGDVRRARHRFAQLDLPFNAGAENIVGIERAQAILCRQTEHGEVDRQA